jgi:predicted TIM-barrel fold metal-dependent hydrolase
MNDWSLEAQAREPRIITYVAIDPVLFGEEAIEELERCVQKGATGVKVHPSNYMHFPDNRNMMPVYERCQELGLGVLSDSRGRDSADGVAYGVPLGWRPVLKTFPHLRFIMAHLCDEMWDDRLDIAKEFHENLWFDMSSGLVDEHHPPSLHGSMRVEQAVRVFRKVGVERIMYGSDGAPGGDGLWGAQQIMALPFTDDEKEALLAGNAKRFFGKA